MASVAHLQDVLITQLLLAASQRGRARRPGQLLLAARLAAGSRRLTAGCIAACCCAALLLAAALLALVPQQHCRHNSPHVHQGLVEGARLLILKHLCAGADREELTKQVRVSHCGLGHNKSAAPQQSLPTTSS